MTSLETHGSVSQPTSAAQASFDQPRPDEAKQLRRHGVAVTHIAHAKQLRAMLDTEDAHDEGHIIQAKTTIETLLTIVEEQRAKVRSHEQNIAGRAVQRAKVQQLETLESTKSASIAGDWKKRAQEAYDQKVANDEVEASRLRTQLHQWDEQVKETLQTRKAATDNELADQLAALDISDEEE